MTREEFSILVKGMKATYTEPKFIPDKDAFDIWYGLLSDLPYEVANAAVQQHMLTNKFAPTIAEIREQAANVVNGPQKDAGQAWADVKKAVSKYGYYEPAKGLASLDPVTRQAAERFGFRELCDMETDDNNTARAQFMRIYNEIVNREREDSKIPQHIRDRLAILRQNAGLLEGRTMTIDYGAVGAMESTQELTRDEWHERKRGKWTNNNACQFCGFQPWFEKDIHTLSYCPNCGADMRGEQDG